MATPIWQASTGAWDTAGNWSTAAVPVDGDSVYFTGASNQSVTSGLTLGASGDALALLHTHADFTGDIGTSGGKLVAGDSITTIRLYSRSGHAYIDTASTTNVYLAGQVTDFAELDGTITNIYAIGAGGSWSITNGAAVTNVRQFNSPNCTCTIGTGVTALTQVICKSGRIINNSAVSGAGSQDNPGMVMVENSYYEHAVGAIYYMIVGAGGYVKHTSSGTITHLVMMPGATFDGRVNRNLSVTVTNLYTYPGSKTMVDNGLNTYAVTNIYNLGGSIDAAVGDQTAI